MDLVILSLVILSLGVIIIRFRLRRHRFAGKPSSTQITTCERGVHLYQVNALDDKDTDIDIIAIHGLDTKSPDTWEYCIGSNKVNWLARPDMLPKKAARARIFYCNWPADLFESSHSRQKTFDEFARLLLAGIKRRPLAANDLTGNDRPIIFIASCIGGVILMKALVNANDSDEYLPLRKATRGIVFLATPFRGTSFQDVAAWAEPGLKAWALMQGRGVSQLLQEVKYSFDLDELVRHFTQLCQNKDHPYQVVNFYETGKMSLRHRLISFLPAIFAQEKPLVDRSSAILDIVKDPLPLDRTHKMMNKFYGPEDPAYEYVAGKIKEILENVHETSQLQQADAWIRKRLYTGDRLRIERLSGEPLSMDQCYINLAIVEQSGRNARGSQGPNDTQKSSQFSLFARLRIEEPDKEVKVVLPMLFSPRKAHNGKKLEPRRVLIRGQAGVGKTTLCKKIVYDFTYGKLWSGLFDRLLWVPLRNLKLKERRLIAGYNLDHLFRNEFFFEHPRADALAKALWSAVKDTKMRTLFLLDGLDEVSQDLDRSGDMFRFLKVLLDQPNVIITSRPHARFPAGLKSLDLELETIGFYHDQLNDYLLRAAFKGDPDKASEVQSFLKAHPLLQGLVRIPIQLDALCYTWDGLSGKSIPQTMTAVYQAIERKLWQKKDVMRLEKWHDGELVTPCHIEGADIDQIFESEIYLLEGFAFTGLFNNIIDFDLKHRTAISKQFKFPGTNILLDKTLPRLSFLRPSEISNNDGNRSYHFLHLTFQEYFAARYFVRQWTAGQLLDCLDLKPSKGIKEIQPAKFLQKYKYHVHYDIFWRFVSGLLDTEGETESLRFLKNIEESPRDLLGPVHQRLVMHCLNELAPREGKSRLCQLRSVLEDQLSQWLLFECKFTRKPPRLAGESELPDQVLIRALTQASDEVKILIVESLVSRPFLQASIINLALSWLSDGVSRDLEITILRMLRLSQVAWSDGTLKLAKYMAARLEDNDQRVQWAAVKALQNRQDLSPDIVKSIAERLEHEDSGIRRAAVEALQNQKGLSLEIVSAIAGRLEDEDWHVKWAAVEALQNQQDLSPEIVNAIAGRLEDNNQCVQWAAVKTLENQHDLSLNIMNAIGGWYEDNNQGIQSVAAEALQNQQDPSSESVRAIAGRLENKDWLVRRTAVEALQNRQDLSPEIVNFVAERLEHEVSHIRRAAIEALQNQQDLSPAIVNAIAGRLKDNDQRVQWAAVRALQNRQDLSPEIVGSIAGRLEHEDSGVRRAALEALQNQKDPSPETVNAIAGRLKDEVSHVRRAAVEMLQSRQGLSSEIMSAIAGQLEDEDWCVRWAAVEALQNQQDLSPEIVSAIAGRLEDEDWHVRWLAVEAFRNRRNFNLETVDHYMESLYRTLMEKSFLEHLYWYVADETSYIVFNIEDIPFEGQHDHFRNTLQRVHTRLKILVPNI
ncbi:ARM repeat-containing protein [Aspergillus ruber CBS 135680]|uniref:ARM repeat-containing protein n=1 Tax=Aspergillus ruber (strain CBS 135680) TaxID=1388766 RepID=A0A017SP49_ASPRC|nr:ARM repeat-containing protein [Aspergillus ruber CBS 135680]EYE98763.1 ARM repeat-containing protein [Aspergillus ruber CBS 135680]